MAGSLVKIDEVIVSSGVSSVELGGSNWDSSYDVYVVQVNQAETDKSSDNPLYIRFLASSSADTSANYDYATKRLKTNASFDNDSNTNQTAINHSMGIDNATGNQINGTFYLFNFNESSEYSFMTTEMSIINSNDILAGAHGGATLTVAQATNGIQFFFNSDNFDNGRFVLYGLNK
jgi:hypothetical protein